MTNQGKESILRLRGVKTHFPVHKGVFERVVGHVKAVDGVDIDIYRGETLGLVGESGCGKTTLGKSILQLEKVTAGKILFRSEGKETDLNSLSYKEMTPNRKKLQIVFQDPYSSLNPVFTIFSSLEDPLKKFGVDNRKKRRQIIGDLLEAVNLRREHMDNYPNEFSGGQRQRIGIARALCVNPELIICDEAVSALDVSIQAQVLKLLKTLKDERNLTYLFITHDLSVVEYISDRIAVMYLGKVVELADCENFYINRRHPYTQALLSAIPTISTAKRSKRIILKGDVPSPLNPPNGCPFHPRCPKCREMCKTTSAKLTDYGEGGREHLVACHYADSDDIEI